MSTPIIIGGILIATFPLVAVWYLIYKFVAHSKFLQKYISDGMMRVSASVFLLLALLLMNGRHRRFGLLHGIVPDDVYNMLQGIFFIPILILVLIATFPKKKTTQDKKLFN